MTTCLSPRATLIDYAVEAATIEPDALAFLGEQGAAEYASLLTQAESLAAALWSRGLRAGDVIAFQLPNWMEAAVVNLAASRLGLVCAPLLPSYRDAELTFMINDSNSRVVFIPATFRSFDFGLMYSRIGAALIHEPLIVTIRGDSECGIRYEALVGSGEAGNIPWPRVALQAIKLLLYTSGTTGRPKAVLHSHETLARALLVSAAQWNLRRGDAVLMPSPVTHATGYANALELPFLCGTRTVLMDRWDARRAVDLIDRFQVAATVGATPFLKELTAAALEADSRLDSLRVFACGGAAVPPAVIREANRVLKNKPAFRVYGSSEAPYVAIGHTASDADDLAATTDGAVVDYDVRIVDAQEWAVAAGAEGEILVRGPAMFLRYANDADTEGSLTADGYFRTGDLGTLGAGSHLTITGRRKDLIIRGGENIGAKDIEDALHGHASVAEAAVVAMPHERLGEGIFAFVIAHAGREPVLSELLAHLQQLGLSRQKYPERMAVVSEFPRTASGKVRKNELRALAAQIVAAGAQASDPQ
jgi:acyl-CoA synthetase (AMP-forming)/AMP-acid ligase II